MIFPAQTACSSSEWSWAGEAEVAIPDNTKTGVKHPCRYEPELNATYRELAEPYAFAVIPARPYKPRDKAKAEACAIGSSSNLETSTKPLASCSIG